MGSDEADENITHRKLYNNYQTIIVSSDIEYIMLVTHRINRTEIHFHFCEAVPLCILSYLIPPL